MMETKLNLIRIFMIYSNFIKTIPSTQGKKLPTYNSISNSGIPTLNIWNNYRGADIKVYANGFATVCVKDENNKERATVLAVDEIEFTYSWVTGGTEEVPVTVWGQMHEVEVIWLCGMDRLDHNTDSREEYHTEFHLDCDGNDFAKELSLPSFEDDLIDKIAKEGEQYRNHVLLMEALASLTEKQRQAITMKYYDDMTQVAIAKELSLKTSSTVSRHIKDAMKNIREFFEKASKK